MMKEEGLRYQSHEFKSWFAGLRNILNRWKIAGLTRETLCSRAGRHEGVSSPFPAPLAVCLGLLTRSGHPKRPEMA